MLVPEDVGGLAVGRLAEHMKHRPVGEADTKRRAPLQDEVARLGQAQSTSVGAAEGSKW